MVCAQLIRNVVIILLLEVSFSFVIANGSKPGNPKQAKCAVIPIANGITKILNANKRNPQPVKVVKGNHLVSRGRSIVYICDDGYQMHGKDTLTCKANGKWSPSLPACLAPLQEVPTPAIRSTVTDRQTTEEVETSTSDNPAVDEGFTTAYDGLPSVATVEKVKTSEAFRVITITVATRTSPPPMSPRVASSTVELHVPTSRPTTLKAEESTVVLPSTPALSSFPDDVMESDTTAFNNLDRITTSSSLELTEAQSTSTSDMFRQDEETKEPDTQTHQQFPDKSGVELEAKVSTSGAYETTSQKPFETDDSIVSSVEMVSETEEQDDTTPETRDHSSVSGLGLKEGEDDDAEMQSPTLESVSQYTVSQELLTVQPSSFRIQVPINEVETRGTPEGSLSSFTMESEDVDIPLRHDSTETDSKGQRSLIVTHFSTKTPTESSSAETLVMTPKKIPTNENKTGKTGSRSHSVLTTHVPPSKQSGYKSTPTIDSVVMTGGSSASSVVLIIIIMAAVIILVVLLVILGKAFLPKCTLLQKPCHEQGAVPYTAQNNQTDQVVLKGINPTPENDRCTQV